GRAHDVSLDAAARHGLPDEHQPLRLAERQRPHQHRVDHPPNRPGRRDAKGDRRYRDERETRPAPETAQRELDVLEELSHARRKSEARASGPRPGEALAWPWVAQTSTPRPAHAPVRRRAPGAG